MSRTDRPSFEGSDDVPPRDQLLTLLADVLDDVEGPNDELVDRAAALFTLRRLDAELMELLSDSRELEASHRSEQLNLRFLTFLGSACTLQLEVVLSKAGQEFIGQVTPAGVHVVEIVDAPKVAQVTTDEHGRFRLPCPAGPVRVLVMLGDGRRQLSPPFEV